MKAENSFGTRKIYYRLVGGEYHGNSFLYVENTQVCFPEVQQYMGDL